MPHACTISNCYNRYNPNSDDGSGFSFHRLPKKNRALRKRWLDAIGTRKKQFNNIGRRRKGFSVCSRHFTPEDFSNLDSKSLKIEGSGKEKRPYRRLKDNAVPSIFPDEVFRVPDVRKKRKLNSTKTIEETAPALAAAEEEDTYSVCENRLQTLMKFCSECGCPVIDSRRLNHNSVISYQMLCTRGHIVNWDALVAPS